LPYAVQLDLDAGTNAALTALADFLGRVPGIETVRSVGDVHHVSLAVYDALDVEPFTAELERFAASLRAVPIALAGLGVFTQQSVLFVAPVVTEPLLQLHRCFHEAFAKRLRDCWEHYHPSHWVPHVTLATETESGGGGLEQALSIVRRHWRPGAARLDAVRLDRFHPVETLFLRNVS
jgi:2'-5' RNA ligase